MRLPRDLSGSDLIKVLCKHYGYSQVDKEGSHVLLQTKQLRHHRIAIPEHKSLRLGTLNAILNAVARIQGIEKAEILDKL